MRSLNCLTPPSVLIWLVSAFLEKENLGSTLLCTGCAKKLKTVTPDVGKRPWLLLVDGQTTREEILARWGPAPREIEAGRILCYRLDSKYEVQSLPLRFNAYPFDMTKTFQWDGVKYSLVLVFDESGILKKHSVTRVR